MGRWALDVAFVWKAALTLGLVLLYYCFSIGITFYNKWLTKVSKCGTGPKVTVLGTVALGHGGFSWILVPGGLSRWLAGVVVMKLGRD